MTCSHFNTLLNFFKSEYIVKLYMGVLHSKLFPILIQCRVLSCFFNNAEFFPILYKRRAISNLHMWLRLTVASHKAELFPNLLQRWATPILILCWGLLCLFTELNISQPIFFLRLSQSFYIAELYATWLRCWAVPYLKTFLMETSVLHSGDLKPNQCLPVVYRT